jgi:hypothetical protein
MMMITYRLAAWIRATWAVALVIPVAMVSIAIFGARTQDRLQLLVVSLVVAIACCQAFFVRCELDGEGIRIRNFASWHVIPVREIESLKLFRRHIWHWGLPGLARRSQVVVELRNGKSQVINALGCARYLGMVDLEIGNSDTSKAIVEMTSVLRLRDG